MARTQRATAREMRSEIDSLTGEDQINRAIEVMTHSRDLETTRYAIGILEKAASAELRAPLVKKYDWCDEQPHRRDGGGFIRAAIVRAMRPISSGDDATLFLHAMQTYEKDGAWETCADLRATGLLAMNDVDPTIAAIMAARFVHDPEATLSDEPAISAMRLLASHDELAPIFGAVCWGIGRPEVLAEGLRNLLALPDALLPMLVAQYIESESEQVVLGLFDLLLGHRTRDSWAATFAQWFRSTTLLDLYGIVAMQIVASRSEVLIAELRRIREDEVDALRCGLLDQALLLA